MVNYDKRVPIRFASEQYFIGWNLLLCISDPSALHRQFYDSNRPLKCQQSMCYVFILFIINKFLDSMTLNNVKFSLRHITLPEKAMHSWSVINISRKKWQWSDWWGFFVISTCVGDRLSNASIPLTFFLLSITPCTFKKAVVH